MEDITTNSILNIILCKLKECSHECSNNKNPKWDFTFWIFICFYAYFVRIFQEISFFFVELIRELFVRCYDS